MFRFWIHLWSSFFQRFSDLRCICVDYFMLLLLGVFVCVFCFLFLFLYCHPDIAILVDWALEAKWLTLFYWFVKKTTPLQLTAKVRAAEKLLDRYGLRFLPSFLYPPPSPTLFFQSAGSVNFTCLMLSFQSAGSVHFTCLILSFQSAGSINFTCPILSLQNAGSINVTSLTLSLQSANSRNLTLSLHSTSSLKWLLLYCAILCSGADSLHSVWIVWGSCNPLGMQAL